MNDPDNDGAGERSSDWQSPRVDFAERSRQMKEVRKSVRGLSQRQQEDAGVAPDAAAHDDTPDASILPEETPDIPKPNMTYDRKQAVEWLMGVHSRDVFLSYGGLKFCLKAVQCIESEKAVMISIPLDRMEFQPEPGACFKFTNGDGDEKDVVFLGAFFPFKEWGVGLICLHYADSTE